MTNNFMPLLRASLKCGVAILPLSIGFTTTSAIAQSANATSTVPTPAAADQAKTDDTASDQPATSSSATATSAKDIVVTGTNIRGIKPVGSNVVVQTREDIKATGVNDLNQVLAELPQSEFFQGLLQPGGGPGGGLGNITAGASRSPIARPNLRSIPGTNNGSGQPTLVLMDGHRIVPSGIDQAVVDVGVVPVGVLDRNEVLLDGASAVYGSDAVAGVINLITRKRYDGVDLDARYGFADNYWQRTFTATVGKTWGSGGITLNYEYSQNSNILQGNRSFTAPLNWLIPNPNNPNAATQFDYLAPAVQGTTCDVPNVTNTTATTNFYHVTGSGATATLAAGPQYCWAPTSYYSSYDPAQVRHSGFGVFEQDITDNVKFDVTGLYTRRKQTSNAGPFTATDTISPSNPYYICNLALTGTCTGTTTARQRVLFSYGPLLGNDSQKAVDTISFWQVTPELVASLGSWQVRALFGYGESDTLVAQKVMDTAAQTALFAGTTLTTTVNPYNIADPRQNFALIQGLIRDQTTEGQQHFTQARIVGDGPLFTLPGGEVRVSFGAEYMRHFARKQQTNAQTFILQPWVSGTTSSKSVFGEIVVPLVSDANKMTLVHSLTLSASGRYDDYGQYGTTFNPKFAATWEPVDWISLRGNWGKSFRAPNAVDKMNTVPNLQCLGNTGCGPSPGNPTNDPSKVYNFTFTGNTFAALYLTGTDPNLGPERSTNWSLGGDIRPPIIPGLTLSASYWKINFKDQIATPGATVNLLVANGADSAVCYPAITPPATNLPSQTSLCSTAQIASFASEAPNGQTVLNFVNSSGYSVAMLLDGRVRNLSSAIESGLDLSARYSHRTGFGSVNASFSAAHPLKSVTQVSTASVPVDNLLTGTSKWRMTATLGATVGNFRAQGTLRHQASFIPADLACLLTPATPCTSTVQPSATRRGDQTRVGEFDQIDLSFTYNFKEDGPLLNGLQLSLNVNNVLNSHPPLNETTTGGVTGGQTLGRMFEFGISKKF